MTRRVTPTYTLISQITLAANGVFLNFSNIPQNFTDLVLVSAPRGDRSATIDLLVARFNNDSGNNYSNVLMFGNGSTTFSFAGTSNSANLDIFPAASASSGIFGSIITNIMDYSASDKHKTIINRYGTQVDGVGANSVRWANSSPITTLQVFPLNASFVAGSTFFLYGVVA